MQIGRKSSRTQTELEEKFASGCFFCCGANVVLCRTIPEMKSRFCGEEKG